MAKPHLPLYDTGVLAHQGGWDEILLVAGPIAAIIVVLWRATLRTDRRIDGRQSDDEKNAQRSSDARDIGSEAGKPAN